MVWVVWFDGRWAHNFHVDLHMLDIGLFPCRTRIVMFVDDQEQPARVCAMCLSMSDLSQVSMKTLVVNNCISIMRLMFVSIFSNDGSLCHNIRIRPM